jgi:hypothetical protein
MIWLVAGWAITLALVGVMTECIARAIEVQERSGKCDSSNTKDIVKM